MRNFDILLQRWRARVARPWVPRGANVLDIGCFDGNFLDSFGDRIGASVGLDPSVLPHETPHYRLVSGHFHEPAPFADASFDAVVLLATLEHIRDKEPLARECYRLLRPNGRLIMTVPSPAVDLIIAALIRCRLADGMALEEHHGFNPRQVPTLFCSRGFGLEKWRRFQLGFNHLFVFRKPALERSHGSHPVRSPHIKRLF